MRLLYIEDDPYFAELLHSEFLSCRTVLWEVVRADCLADARARIESEEFDAVLADLLLPGSEEVATCQELCRLLPTTPLVVLAHGDGLDFAVEAVQCGAQDCLFKGSLSGPFVTRRVRFAVERNAARRQSGSIACAEPVLSQQQPSAAAGALRQLASGKGTAPPGPASATGGEDAANRWGPLRVLHVEDDPSYAAWMRQQLESAECEVEHCTSLQRALAKLRQGGFAAVVLDLSLPDSDGMETVDAVLARAAGIPVVVVTAHHDESLAVQAIRKGVEDYLVKTGLPASMPHRSLCLAIARQGLETATGQSGESVRRSEPVWRAVSAAEKGSRRHARYLLNKPVVAFPIRYNNSPDTSDNAAGMLLDLSSGGLAFQLPQSDPVATRRWIVGIEAEDGRHDYAAVEVRNTLATASGLRVGAKFARGQQDLLDDTNLTPAFDPATGRMTTRIPARILDKWVALGVMRQVLLNRVFACPTCRALAAFGNSCPACGSAELAYERQLCHHACGYSGPVGEFEARDHLRCPQCGREALVLDDDFQTLAATCHCMACGQSNVHPRPRGWCLHCLKRFAMDDAVEEELIGYQANRLNPQAHLDSA
jgi:DNA-binding response OmpR family regulator